jgi:hypothetical protein
VTEDLDQRLWIAGETSWGAGEEDGLAVKLDPYGHTCLQMEYMPFPPVNWNPFESNQILTWHGLPPVEWWNWDVSAVDVQLQQEFVCDDEGEAKRPMPEDCATTPPGTRCNASGTCTQDSDCAGESHCVPPPAGDPPGGVCYAPKTRYLSVASNPDQACSTARRVKLDDGTMLGWVGEPVWQPPTSQHDGMWLSDVVATPYYANPWPDLLQVYTCEVAHASLCDVSGNHCGPNLCSGSETCVHHCYEIQAIVLGDDTEEEGNYSEVLELCTNSVWGDTVGSCPGNVCTPPNGIVNLDDVQAAMKYYENNRVAPITWLDIDPSNGDQCPNQNIGIGDILKAIDGFQGKPYPGNGPKNCE